MIKTLYRHFSSLRLNELQRKVRINEISLIIILILASNILFRKYNDLFLKIYEMQPINRRDKFTKYFINSEHHKFVKW